MSDFVLSAVLELRDRMTGRIRTAARGLDSVRSMAGSASSSLDRASSSLGRTESAAGRLQRRLSGLDGNHRINIDARDNASQRISTIQQRLSSIAGRTYTATVNIRQNGMAQMGRLTEGLSGMANGMLMGTGVQMMGAMGLGYGAVDIIKTYKDFEYQMASVKAVTGANADEMARLTQRAKELGESTIFKASDVAKAEEYMGFAGWKTAQIEAGLPAVVDLAAAAGEDLKIVSDIVTDAMTGFGLRATDEIKTVDGRIVNATKHFTDIMAALATNANTTVSMAGESAKYAAAVVGSLYSSQSAQDKMNAVSDWAVIEGLMANAGIKGSMAGTAQRAMLTRLASLQQNANAARQALGVDFVYQESGVDELGLYHEKGQTKRLRDIIGDIRDRYNSGMSTEDVMAAAELLEGKQFSKQQRAKISAMLDNIKANGGAMTDQDKATMTTMLSGQEGLAAWLSVLLAREEDVNSLMTAIDNAHGKAAEQAETKRNTLEGDLNAFSAAWEGFQLELMEGKGGEGIRSFVQAATKDIRDFKKSLEDGFDIGDIAGLTGNIIKQLKDKFLELDGVGSILAGGALAYGLVKIAGLGKSAYQTLRGLATLGGPARAGATTLAPSTVTSNLSSMVVHANSVVVNGRSIMGGPGGGVPSGRTPGNVILGPNGRPLPPSQPVPPAPSPAPVTSTWKTGMGYGALAGIFGALDVSATKKDRDRIREEEKYSVELATKAVNEASSYLKELSNKPDATAEDIQEATNSLRTLQTELKNAKQHQQDSERMSTELMGNSVGGAVGSVAGAAIGGVLGGPVGAMIGGTIGDYAGKAIGEKLSFFWQDEENKKILAKQSVEDTRSDILSGNVNTGDSYDAVAMPALETAAQAADVSMGKFRELEAQVQQTSAAVEDVSATSAAIADNFPEIQGQLEAVGLSLDELEMDAGTTGMNISQSMRTSSEEIKTTWSEVPPFFDEAVYAPVVEGADPCGAALAAGVNSGIPDIQSAWAGVESFIGGILARVSSAASSIAAKASNFIFGSSEVGGNAIGTSYWSGGWTEINEHGGEIIDLPEGSRIYPHATTMSMLKSTFGDSSMGFMPQVSQMGSMLSRMVDNMVASMSSSSRQDKGSSAPFITITGNEFVVREDADIDRIAHKLFQLIEQSAGNYQWTGA